MFADYELAAVESQRRRDVRQLQRSRDAQRHRDALRLATKPPPGEPQSGSGALEPPQQQLPSPTH